MSSAIQNNLKEQLEWLRKNSQLAREARFQYAPAASRNIARPIVYAVALCSLATYLLIASICRYSFETASDKKSNMSSTSTITQLGSVDLEAFRWKHISTNIIFA